MREPISQEIKQYILDNYWYDPNTGKIYLKHSDKEIGYYSDNYIELSITYKNQRIRLLGQYMACLLMQVDLSKLDNDHVIHHKNNNKHDNRWSNLEIISKSLNSLYSQKRNNFSGFRGVHITSSLKMTWFASVIINNIIYYLGCYSEKHKAAQIYDDFIIYKIPEFDRKYLNFPERLTETISIKLQQMSGKQRGRIKPPLPILEEYINKNIKYNSITGEFFSLISNKNIGSSKENNYTRISLEFGKYSIKISGHRLAWFLSYQEWPPINRVIDHINRNKSDNRIKNLRLTSYQENNANVKKPKNNTTNYLGVVLRKNNIYQSMLMLNNIKFHLGNFRDLITAAELYDDVKYHFFQEKACLNFPNRTPQPVAPELLTKIQNKLEASKK